MVEMSEQRWRDVERIFHEIVDLDDGQIEQWRNEVEGVNRQLAEEDVFSLSLYEDVTTALAEFRAGTAQAANAGD